MLTLATDQSTVLAQAATQPTYLVTATWGGPVNWSTRAAHTIDGITYTPGEVSVRGARNWESATLAIAPSAASTAHFLSGDWVDTDCVISLYPYREHPGIVDAGYFADGYGAFDGIESGAPIVLLAGFLAGGQYSGDGPITLEVRHKSARPLWAPRTLIGPPIANHLPAPGTKFTWAGEVYILESGG